MKILAFAAGIVVGTLTTLTLLNLRPVTVAVWVEQEDGVQPLDAYLSTIERELWGPA